MEEPAPYFIYTTAVPDDAAVGKLCERCRLEIWKEGHRVMISVEGMPFQDMRSRYIEDDVAFLCDPCYQTIKPTT